MRRTTSLFALLALAWPTAFAASEELVVAEQAGSVARVALPTFQLIVEQQKNYREMGFKSLDELDRIKLGEPLLVFMVRLDELDSYEQDDDPNELLHGGQRVFFPVVVDDQVRSSITVAETAKGLEVTSFGGPNKIRLISKARTTSVEATSMAAREHFVVEIPGLNLVFVGYRTNETLMLVPVLDHRGFEFKKGVPIMARDVFTRVSPVVKSHMDAPG